MSLDENYLAQIWKITRVDGQEFYFTDHDQNLTIDGQEYLTANGFERSEIEKVIGLEKDNLTIIGALSEQQISEHDLDLGLYDRADVLIHHVQWKALEVVAELFRGRISNISYSKNKFFCELKSPFDKLDQNFGKRYIKSCEAVFCDEQCGLDASNFSHDATLHDLSGMSLQVLYIGDPEKIANGVLRFNDRENFVRDLPIRNAHHDGYLLHIELWEKPKFDVEIGEALTLFEGCDKSFANCVEQFQNAVNFRGFPHLPEHEILLKNAQDYA